MCLQEILQIQLKNITKVMKQIKKHTEFKKLFSKYC